MIRWIDITKSQLEKFIGINIIMGYCKNPLIDTYWSTDGSFRNERISMSMSAAKKGTVSVQQAAQSIKFSQTMEAQFSDIL